MMRQKWWALLLIMLGSVIAMVSLFQAVVMGTVEKIGLLGQDPNEMFDRAALSQKMQRDSDWRCADEMEWIGSLRYYLSTGQQKIDIGWGLGEARLRCGVKEIVKGNAVAGAYKIIRGARYWENSAIMIEQRGNSCELAGKANDIERLTTIRMLARGSAKVEIGKIEDRLIERMMYETERCIDHAKSEE